jgi:rfaE bifunctional protein kinase chain/domain
VISEVIAASERVAVPVLVDPKFRSFDLYRKVKLFKPNFKELTKGLDLDISNKEIEKVAEAVKAFQAKQSIDTILVTLSEQGILASQDGEQFHIPAMKREIIDVSGAGDTVIAVAALCLVAGLPPAELAAISNLAGGQVCEKAGVIPVNPERLLEECTEHFRNA